MRLAAHESIIPGSRLATRAANARTLGLHGIAFRFDDVVDRVEETAAALVAYDLGAAELHVGGTYLLHPDPRPREFAVLRLQQAITTAIDLGATGVTFHATHPDVPRLPDLYPYKTSEELEGQLLLSQLRSALLDFANALDARLLLEPEPEDRTHLITQLSRAETILRLTDYHSHLGIAIDNVCLATQEDEPLAALAAVIRHVHVVTLMPETSLDDAGLVTALAAADFEGWLILDGGEPDDLPRRVASLQTHLDIAHH